MTEPEVLAWIAELFEVSAEDISADTPRDDVEAWDSLGVLTLMAGLDSDFGIVLTDDEVVAMESIGDILNALRSHGQLT